MKKTILMGAAFTLLAAGSVFAQGTPRPTPEQREKMAVAHEKMAACLRTNKPMSDCANEMRQSKACPMACPMGHMGMQSGRAAVELPKDVIPLEKAAATAVKKYPGTVQSSELEQEEGRWVYSFDIVSSDKNIHEVWVDAKTNKIVKHEMESAGEEADE